MTASEYKQRAIKERQNKDQLISAIAEDTDLTGKVVRAVLHSLAEHGKRHLNEDGSGEFVIPDLGIKLKRNLRPASKERTGRNPVTGEQITIPGKPARHVVRASVMKSLHESLGFVAKAPASESARAERPKSAAAVQATHESIIGTWKSDRAASQKEADMSPKLTPEQKQTLSEMFGKLVATYSNDIFTTEFEGKVNSYQYTVAGTGPNYVEIEYHNSATGKTERNRMYVQGNTLWVDAPEYGFSEVFRRVV